MLKKISQIFMKGFLTILPIIITIALLVWLIDIFEAIFGSFLNLLLPHNGYRFGMGFLLGLIVIFLTGFFIQMLLGRKIFDFFEKIILHIPFVKEVYHPIKQIQHIFSRSEKEKKGRAVIVKIKDGLEMIGIILNENIDQQLKREGNKVAVLLFWSYQIGGFTVFVDPKDIEPLNISAEAAIKLAVTGGINMQTENKKNDQRRKTA